MTIDPTIQKGILQGHVTIGPLCPVEPCNISPEQKEKIFAEYKLYIYVEERIFEEVNLDKNGDYSVVLTPGKYTVDISYTRIGRSNLPQDIQIEPGKTIILDINIDTGIR